MRVLVAGRPVRVSSKVGQVLAQQGDTFRPAGCWPATIDGRRDQLIAVLETGLVLVTDDGVRTLPWAGISAVEASDGGSLQRTFLALSNGDRHSIIQYGPTDRADLRRMVPQHLLDHPATATATDEPSEAAIPLHEAPGAGRTAAPALGPSGLALRASRVSRALDVLAVLVALVLGLLTLVAAALYAEAFGPLGFLLAALIGSIMTAVNWAGLRLGSVVAEYIATRGAG